MVSLPFFAQDGTREVPAYPENVAWGETCGKSLTTEDAEWHRGNWE